RSDRDWSSDVCSSDLSAMAAPVPRVSEHARALIRRRARFRSEPSEPNSYWTVVDAGLSGAHASGSKLIASGSRISFVAKAANARSEERRVGEGCTSTL